MPSAPKNPSTASASKESPPFEEALTKLESIVEAMETGDLPLETLLARFEEGTRLIKICQTKLDDVEVKISKLEKDAAGEPVLKAVTASALEAD